jgi:hypothetical protein
VAFNIHTVMQNANDLNTLVTMTVENEMSANMIFPVACPDIIASLSYSRLRCNRMKTGVKHDKVFVPLIPLPFLRSKTSD